MWREIFASLMRNKLRTALTGLSVSVGIFLLIFLLGAGNGLIHAFEKNSGQMALNVMKLWPGSTSKPYDGWEKGRAIRFDASDIPLAQQAGRSRVTEAIGTASQPITIAHGEKTGTGNIVGHYPENFTISKMKLVAGRYINAIDMKERRRVLVLGERVATELCESPQRAIGKVVSADGAAYRIVGVYADKGEMGEMQAHTPFTTLQTIYNQGNNVPTIVMQTHNASSASGDSILRSDLRRAFATRHRFDPTDESALWMWNSSRGAEETATAMSILRNALWFIGLLTLLSGIVGVSNIMLITVKERTHEFGIRKALGARPWSILRSVMAESILITGFFGYVGMVAGIAATEWLNVQAGTKAMEVADMKMEVFLNPTVDLGIALQALLVLVIAGMIAGFVPARKAVRVKPVEALNAR